MNISHFVNDRKVFDFIEELVLFDDDFVVPSSDGPS